MLDDAICQYAVKVERRDNRNALARDTARLRQQITLYVVLSLGRACKRVNDPARVRRQLRCNIAGMKSRLC